MLGRVLICVPPGFKRQAIWLLQTDLQQILVNRGLSFKCFFWPRSCIVAVVVAPLVASNVNFSEVNLQANFVVSLDILANRFIILRIIGDVNVALEADTINWASAFLEVFYKVEHFVRLFLVPTHHRSVLIVIVEKLS